MKRKPTLQEAFGQYCIDKELPRLERQIIKYQKDIKDLKAENARLLDLLEDVLWQAIGSSIWYLNDEPNLVDNMCISAYEDACEFLHKQGRLIDYNGRCGYLKEK